MSHVAAATKGSTLPGIPAWEPEETLYSWCTRFDSAYGRHTQKTGVQLFGRAHAYLLDQYPSGMAHFNAATRGRLGSVEDIIRSRTVAALYWPFMTLRQRSDLVQSTLESSRRPAPASPSFSSTAWSAVQELRFCEACATHDETRRGHARWLLVHQLPGVWLCLRHMMPLCRVRSTSISWKRPMVERASAAIDLDSTETLDALAKLASIISAVPSLERVDTSSLAAAALEKMLRQGLITTRSRCRERAVLGWFNATGVGRILNRNASVQAPPGGAWIAKLLAGRHPADPLQWALLWTALDEGRTVQACVGSFVDAASSQSLMATTVQRDLWPVAALPLASVRPTEEMSAVLDECISLKDAAAGLRMPVAELAMWLKRDLGLARRWRSRLRSERKRRELTELHAQAATTGREQLRRRSEVGMGRSVQSPVPVFATPTENPQGDLFPQWGVE